MVKENICFMRRLIIIACVCLCSFGLYAQNYNELVEEAMACAQKDSLARAEQLFREALKLDPKNARNALLFSNLGTVLKRQGKADEAIEAYTMALNITPYATAILLNRAALYLDKGLLEKAYIDYCNVIDLIPEEKEARLFRAYIYMQRHQYKEARIDYNVLLGKDAKNKPARIGLAMLDQKEGKFIAARDRLNLLVEEYPQDASLLKMRANVELEQEFTDMALLDLEAAAKLDPNDADVYVMMGDIYVRQKKKHQARQAYEQAIKLGISALQLEEKLKEVR